MDQKRVERSGIQDRSLTHVPASSNGRGGGAARSSVTTLTTTPPAFDSPHHLQYRSSNPLWAYRSLYRPLKQHHPPSRHHEARSIRPQRLDMVSSSSRDRISFCFSLRLTANSIVISVFAIVILSVIGALFKVRRDPSPHTSIHPDKPSRGFHFPTCQEMGQTPR
jgi:hypothetical protein